MRDGRRRDRGIRRPARAAASLETAAAPGAPWARATARLTVALLRCDGDEEVGPIVSADPS